MQLIDNIKNFDKIIVQQDYMQIIHICHQNKGNQNLDILLEKLIQAITDVKEENALALRRTIKYLINCGANISCTDRITFESWRKSLRERFLPHAFQQSIIDALLYFLFEKHGKINRLDILAPELLVNVGMNLPPAFVDYYQQKTESTDKLYQALTERVKESDYKNYLFRSSFKDYIVDLIEASENNSLPINVFKKMLQALLKKAQYGVLYVFNEEEYNNQAAADEFIEQLSRILYNLVKNKNIEFVDVFLDSLHDFNRMLDYPKAYVAAIENNDMAMLICLKKYKISDSINFVPSYADTVLHQLISESKNNHLCQLLLEIYPPQFCWSLNQNGNSLCDIAIKSSNVTMIDFLFTLSIFNASNYYNRNNYKSVKIMYKAALLALQENSEKKAEILKKALTFESISFNNSINKHSDFLKIIVEKKNLNELIILLLYANPFDIFENFSQIKANYHFNDDPVFFSLLTKAHQIEMSFKKIAKLNHTAYGVIYLDESNVKNKLNQIIEVIKNGLATSNDEHSIKIYFLFSCLTCISEILTHLRDLYKFSICLYNFVFHDMKKLVNELRTVIDSTVCQVIDVSKIIDNLVAHNPKPKDKVNFFRQLFFPPSIIELIQIIFDQLKVLCAGLSLSEHNSNIGGLKNERPN